MYAVTAVWAVSNTTHQTTRSLRLTAYERQGSHVLNAVWDEPGENRVVVTGSVVVVPLHHTRPIQNRLFFERC